MAIRILLSLRNTACEINPKRILQLKNKSRTTGKLDTPFALGKVCFVLFLLNVPVNNFSVMSGRSNCFLGITSTFGR